MGILEMAFEYGPIGLISGVVVFLLIWNNRQEKKITDLEKKDLKIDGEIENINSQLGNLNVNVKDIKENLQTLINHFAVKGMGE